MEEDNRGDPSKVRYTGVVAEEVPLPRHGTEEDKKCWTAETGNPRDGISKASNGKTNFYRDDDVFLLRFAVAY